jgi:hypothetical protein
MDRITHQLPRQRGYGSTSSLRNDSLKHTRKHERRRRGIEPRSKARSLWRTVRPDRANRPRWAARTVRQGTADCLPLAADCPAWAADRPLKPNRTNRDAPAPWTVRGEHTDCLPGTRGPSALCYRPSETPSNQKPKTRQIETKDEKEHEEHGMNPSGWRIRWRLERGGVNRSR